MFMRRPISRGLSPLARGTLVRHRHAINRQRFIPAGAGNTWRAIRYRTQRTVYPRWRGEHTFNSGILASARGLSPLARGTLGKLNYVAGMHRFIPAGAGNTEHNMPMIASFAVYPRWRGEHVLASINVCADEGLSPLARGTPQKLNFPQEIIRFIPAGAGNTFVATLNATSLAVYPRWRGEHFKYCRSSLLIAGLSPLARGTRLRLR